MLKAKHAHLPFDRSFEERSSCVCFHAQDVQWWHALPLQAAETAVAMGVRLNQASSGQVTASEVAYMAVAYLAIGLVPPAAALCWRGSGDGEPHGEAIRIGCQQQQQKDILEGWLVPRSGSSEAEMVRITQLDFQKLLSRWPSFMRTWNSDAPPELLSPRCGAAEPPSPEDVLQLLCQLVSRGLLNASQVEQQLELAVKRGQEEGRVLLQARRSSGSSSRCPSTRPSTSFSSSSAVCEAALLSLSLGGGGPLTATPSPVELLPNALDQPPLQQPHPQQQQQPLQQQEGAAAAHCPRALAMHTAAGPCVQLPGRQRLLMRSRTAASLGAHCRQELPPIVEVAHEGFQPQLAALRSTCQLPVQQAADPCLAQRWSWPLAASVLAQLDAHFALPGRAAGASRASCDGHGAQEEEGRRALSKPRPGSTRQVKSEDGLVAGADCGGAEQGLGLNRSILEVTDASCRTRGLMTLVGPPQPPTARHGTYPCAALQGSAIPAPEQLPQQQLEQLSGDGAGSAHEAVEGDAREQGPRGSGEVVAPPQGSSTSADCSCSSHAASGTLRVACASFHHVASVMLGSRPLDPSVLPASMRSQALAFLCSQPRMGPVVPSSASCCRKHHAWTSLPCLAAAAGHAWVVNEEHGKGCITQGTIVKGSASASWPLLRSSESKIHGHRSPLLLCHMPFAGGPWLQTTSPQSCARCALPSPAPARVRARVVNAQTWAWPTTALRPSCPHCAVPPARAR